MLNALSISNSAIALQLFYSLCIVYPSSKAIGCHWICVLYTSVPSGISSSFDARQGESYLLHYRLLKQRRRQDYIIAFEKLFKNVFAFELNL